MAYKSIFNRLFILLLFAFSISACDPNSLLGKLATGAGECERAVVVLSDCCKVGRLSAKYTNACKDFDAGITPYSLEAVISSCEVNAGFTASQDESKLLLANTASSLDCVELLDALDALWTKTDGDFDSDSDNDFDFDFDKEDEEDDSACYDGKPCDDMNPCTTEDACMNGVCSGDLMDCSHMGNECNEGVCENGACVAKAFQDDIACNDSTQCSDFACKSGECLEVSVTDGKPCDDEDPCTIGDRCLSGQCKPVQPKDCSMFNDECNRGICDEGTCVAQTFDDLTVCINEDPCSINSVCDKGQCIAGSLLNCSEFDDQCTEGYCEDHDCKRKNLQNDTACNDDDPCSIGDRCVTGSCLAVGAKNCADAFDCTENICEPATGNCLNPVSVGYCLIEDICYEDDDTNPNAPDCQYCKRDLAINAWSAKPDDTDCDDDNECTIGDTCLSGQCTNHDSLVNCVDVYTCTEDICNPVTGLCSNNLKAGNCLIDGTCYADDDQSIIEPDCAYCNSSQVTDAWTARADTTECDDDNECTNDDSCLSGQCTEYDSTVDCTDPLDCTTDTCNEADGLCSNELQAGNCLIDNVCYADDDVNISEPDCAYCNSSLLSDSWSARLNGTGCNDQNLCTLGDYCDNGTCSRSASTVDCSDSLDCTDDLCDPEDGNCSNPIIQDKCLIDGACFTNNDPDILRPDCMRCNPYVHNRAWSIKPDFCMLDDLCFADQSANPDELECQYCESLNPYNWSNRPDNITSCSDQDQCTLNDSCEAGHCVSDGNKECPEPSNPCWEAVCFPSTGNCSFDTFAHEGEICQSGDPCKVDEICSNGFCEGDFYDCTELDDQCHQGTCYDDNDSPACTSSAFAEDTKCNDSDQNTVNDACNQEENCVGQNLPLSTDESGILLVSTKVTDSGTSSPLCVSLQIASDYMTELWVSLQSPQSTSLNLHNRTVATNPLVIELDTDAFDGELRAGIWTLSLVVDDPAHTATLNSYSLEFINCPNVDGDLDSETELDDELEIELETEAN